MVLAAIIGLPMLLESEPQSLADDFQIHIPSIDKAPVDTRVASLADETQAAPLVPVSVETKPQEPAAKPAAPAPAPASAPKPAPGDKAEKPKADKSPSVSAPAAPAAKPETPRNTPSASSTESERAAQVRALLEGKNTPVASTAKSSADNKTDAKTDAKQGKFALQVAALGSVEKAKELQGRLSKAGINSYTEKVKVSGSEQIRVRVGPFASREEADRMRGKLSDLGLNGMVMPL